MEEDGQQSDRADSEADRQNARAPQERAGQINPEAREESAGGEEDEPLLGFGGEL